MGKRIPVTVDVSDDSTEVSTERVKLWGVYVTTELSEHDLPIKNGAGDTIFTIAAETAAGASYEFFGAEFDGLAVDPDNSATGGITLVIERAT